MQMKNYTTTCKKCGRGLNPSSEVYYNKKNKLCNKNTIIKDSNKKNVISKNYSDNTIISYIDDLYYFYLNISKDLDKVNENDIRDYLEFLNKKKEKLEEKVTGFYGSYLKWWNL